MTFLLPFLFSLLLTLILIPLSIKFSNKFGLVDNPKSHKHPAILHSKIMPRAGGLPIYVATLVSSLVFLPMSQKLIGILLGGLVVTGVGALDDKYDLRSRTKLIAQILGAFIVVASGVGIAFIPNPISAIIGNGYEVIRLDSWRIAFDFFGNHSVLVLASLTALFWIVWVINMVNFSSGVDGQMPGIVFVTLLVIFAATLKFLGTDPDQIIVSKLSLIGAGATLGFLLFNFYPARIFPGDSGSYFLGFLIAVCAILSGAKVGTAMLVMSVPLIDGVFTIIRRLATKKSPFTGDRKHLHHRLLELGWNQREVALFYYIVCVILGAVALRLAAIEKLFAGIVIVVIILGALLWINMNLYRTGRKH